MDRWQWACPTHADLDREVWQWSENQRMAWVERELFGEEGTLERTIAEYDDAIMQAAWAEACDEAERAMNYREASCLNCRQTWWNYDGYDGPCTHCWGRPLDEDDEDQDGDDLGEW